VAEVSWLLFLAASLVVILTPGQDMILVMSRSIGQGRSRCSARVRGAPLSAVQALLR
jgi:threonine/homoserine/homoserine lactone efflux protein